MSRAPKAGPLSADAVAEYERVYGGVPETSIARLVATIRAAEAESARLRRRVATLEGRLAKALRALDSLLMMSTGRGKFCKRGRVWSGRAPGARDGEGTRGE